MGPDNPDEVKNELQRALAEAFNAGYRKGLADAKSEIWQALSSVTNGEQPPLADHISTLGLSERTLRTLRRAQISTVGQLTDKTAEDLLRIINFGMLSLDEVTGQLAEHDLKLKEE